MRWALALTLVGLTACLSERPDEAAPPSLREVAIPADFTFRTSDTVALELAPPDSVFGATPDAPVEVRRPDGAVLYRGAVRKGIRLKVEVSVPTHVDSVDVAIGRERSVIQVRGDAARDDD